MQKLIIFFKHRLKALTALVVAFIAALIAQVNSGGTLDRKTVLIALGTAIVTAASVHTTPNL